MKRRRGLALWPVAGLLLLTASLFLLGACSTVDEPPVPPAPEQDRLSIGITFDTFVVERWQRDRDAFVAACRNEGADVDVQNPNGDPEEQAEQIRYFIEQDMDAILIVAIEPETIREEISAARAAGIPVIAYDRLIPEQQTDLYISFDSVAVGRFAGEVLARELEPGSAIAIINGAPSDHNSSLLREGFEQGSEAAAFEVVYETNAIDWRAEEAYSGTLAALRAAEERGTTLAGIMCANDGLAAEAIRALSEQRLAGAVLVTGQDADLVASQHIAEGTQVMTAYKPVERLAQEAAKYALILARGGQIEADEFFSSGSFSIPSVRLEPVLVTAANLQEVIVDSGFHSAQDVYRFAGQD